MNTIRQAFRIGISKRALKTALAMLLGSASVAGHAAPVLDQFQLDGSDQNQAIHSVRPIGQTFTVGVTGVLQSIELSLRGGDNPVDDLVLELLDFSGGDISTASSLGSTSVSLASLGSAPSMLSESSITASLIDVSSLNVGVVSGDALAFRLSSAAQLPSLYAARISLSDTYAGGSYFVGTTFLSTADAAFKVFVEPSVAVPEPETLSLLGAGLFGLGFMRRRRAV